MNFRPDTADTPYNSPDASQHRLLDHLHLFVRHFWIFLISIVGGYLLGLYIYSLTPETFRSTATIEILRVKQDAADVDEEEKVRINGGGEMLSVSEKLKLPSLYVQTAEDPLFANRADVTPDRFLLPWQESHSRTSAEMGPQDLGAMMRNWVTVRWRTNTALIDISAIHSDPEIARDTLAGLLSAYEKSTESKLAGSSEYALQYILESSSTVKSKILDLDKALRLYNRCLELSQEIRDSERQIAEMEKRYLPKWPALVEAKELRTILKKRFSDELRQVIRLSQDEEDFWRENQRSIENLDPDARIDSEIQLVSARSSVLERELEAEQQIYDNLITKLKEGNLSRGFESKQFDVVQPPDLPKSPVAPNKKDILTKYTAGGAAVGIAIILLLGFLDPSVRTVSELEHLTGLSVIGALTAVKDSERRSSLAFVDESDTQTAEAIRTLRAGLTFLGTTKERCTFLITSSIPGEGKSFIASNLALSFALQGDRTLLIDADMRRPVQSEIFGYERNMKGLSDHLSLKTPIKEILKKSSRSNQLYLLPAGSHSANPSELLAGKSLAPLIESLSEYFDRIIIDSAPLVPVSDSIPLAKLAQSIVLVSRMGRTPRGAIRRALRILRENHSEPVGVVANALPKTRTKGAYGYYYSYYGGGKYSEYSDHASRDNPPSPVDSRPPKGTELSPNEPQGVKTEERQRNVEL